MQEFYVYYCNILLDIIELDEKIEDVLVDVGEELQHQKRETRLISLSLRLNNLRDDRLNKYEQLNKLNEVLEKEE